MKNLFKVIGFFLLVWLVVSIYFYQQHNITVKEATIPGWQLENQEFQVKKIRLLNKERIRRPLEIDFRMKVLMNTPRKLQPYLSKVLYFYSSPYKKLENNGLKAEIVGAFIGNEFRDSLNFSIKTDKGYTYNNSINQQTSDGSNLIFFTAEAKYGIDPNASYFDIEYTLNNNKVTLSVYPKDFNTTNYNYFSRIPNVYNEMNAGESVNTMISDFKSGKSISDYFINSDVKDAFLNQSQWMKEKTELHVFAPFSNYVGKYKKYNNVFTATVSYDYDFKNDRDDAQQVFYLIEENGKWKIIDLEALIKNPIKITYNGDDVTSRLQPVLIVNKTYVTDWSLIKLITPYHEMKVYPIFIRKNGAWIQESNVFTNTDWSETLNINYIETFPNSAEYKIKRANSIITQELSSNSTPMGIQKGKVYFEKDPLSKLKSSYYTYQSFEGKMEEGEFRFNRMPLTDFLKGLLPSAQIIFDKEKNIIEIKNEGSF